MQIDLKWVVSNLLWIFVIVFILVANPCGKKVQVIENTEYIPTSDTAAMRKMLANYLKEVDQLVNNRVGNWTTKILNQIHSLKPSVIFRLDTLEVAKIDSLWKTYDVNYNAQHKLFSWKAVKGAEFGPGSKTVRLGNVSFRLLGTRDDMKLITRRQIPLGLQLELEGIYLQQAKDFDGVGRAGLALSSFYGFGFLKPDDRGVGLRYSKSFYLFR